MVFLCIACIVLSSIALHGIALHRIAWHCMVLQRLHGVVQLIWRAGELPRSASSHFDDDDHHHHVFVNVNLNMVIRNMSIRASIRQSILVQGALKLSGEILPS